MSVVLWLRAQRKLGPCFISVQVSSFYSKNAKRPETAAALNSGPALPGAQDEEKVDRSSLIIMPNYQRQLQDILHKFPKFFEPSVSPDELRFWIQQNFPK
jgi:hypothetical protein